MSEHSTTATIDFDRLLAPIPGDNPAGEDLRSILDQSYLDLRQLCEESRRIEKNHFLHMGVQGHADDPAAEYSLKDCRWKEVRQLSLDVLAEKSKSYEVVAWLCESALRVDGFCGFRDGLRLARELAEQYWEEMFPQPDEDEGFTPRLKLFQQLFDRPFADAIKNIPLTESDQAVNDGFTFLEYTFAKDQEGITDAEERARKFGGRRDVNLAGFVNALRDKSSTEFCQTLLADAADCLEELGLLSTLWHERCGKDDTNQDVAPSTREVADTLRQCIDTVYSIVGDRLAANNQLSEDGDDGEGVPGRGGRGEISKLPGSNGEKLNRQTAIGLLIQLADYFAKVEPHSPVSYHIREAARWGGMSLPDLLSELIPDESLRNDLFKRVGIEIANEQEPYE